MKSNSKDIFVIEHEGIKYCGMPIHNNGHEIICYGNNKLFTLYDNTSDTYYDETTDSMVEGEIHFGSIITDYCVIPEYDKILNTIKL